MSRVSDNLTGLLVLLAIVLGGITYLFDVLINNMSVIFAIILLFDLIDISTSYFNRHYGK